MEAVASEHVLLANLTDRLSVVRSFKTNHAEHNGAAKQFLTADLTVGDGKPIVEPGLGALYSRIAGPIDPRTGMIRHVAIPPTTRYLPERAGFAGSFEAVVEGLQPAWLGASCAPLQFQVKMAQGTQQQPAGGGRRNAAETFNPLLVDLQPNLSVEDLDNRLALLRQLDQFNRRADASGNMDALDQYTRMAIDVLRGDGVRRALDLAQEDPLDRNLGRHHHPKICPLVFAGGGLRHGQVIGRSNDRGSEPDGTPLTIDDLHATILHNLFDIGQLRVDDSLPSKLIDRAQRGRPIAELI